jgi:hypothetical protein
MRSTNIKGSGRSRKPAKKPVPSRKGETPVSSRRAFCVFINTSFEGSVPSVRGGDGEPYVFETEIEAQREIVDNAMTQLQEFLDGDRDFELAIGVEEYVEEVEVFPDGSVLDSRGKRFGRDG